MLSSCASSFSVLFVCSDMVSPIWIVLCGVCMMCSSGIMVTEGVWCVVSCILSQEVMVACFMLMFLCCFWSMFPLLGIFRVLCLLVRALGVLVVMCLGMVGVLVLWTVVSFLAVFKLRVMVLVLSVAVGWVRLVLSSGSLILGLWWVVSVSSVSGWPSGGGLECCGMCSSSFDCGIVLGGVCMMSGVGCVLFDVIDWSNLAWASRAPSMHAFVRSSVCLFSALFMHSDMYSDVNSCCVEGAMLLCPVRFLAGGCVLLMCRLSYGISKVVLRFLIGPFDSFTATSAMLCAFLFSDWCVSMIVPCVMLLLCVCFDMECLGLSCIVLSVTIFLLAGAASVGGMGVLGGICGVVVLSV